MTAFSDRMSQHYTSVLASMHGFVDKYFCPEDMPKNQRLVKGLLELIQADDTDHRHRRFCLYRRKAYVQVNVLQSGRI